MNRFRFYFNSKISISFRKVLKEKLQCNCFSKSYIHKKSNTKAQLTTYFTKLSTKNSSFRLNTKNDIAKSNLQLTDGKSKVEEELVFGMPSKTNQPDYEKFWEFPQPASSETIGLKTNIDKTRKKT